MTISSSPGRVLRIADARADVRAGLAIVAAAVCAVLMLVAAAHARRGPIVRSVENGGDWYARSPGWFNTRGLYPTEHAPDGSPFAWATGRVRLAVPRLDRGIAYRLDLRARSGRPAVAATSTVRIVVDGVDRGAASIGADWQNVPVVLPAARGYGAVVLLEAQETFTPGSKDPRQLAFMIDQLTLTPIDAASVPVWRPVLYHVALWASAVALAALICALPASIAWAAATAAGAAAAALLLFDSAFLNDYSSLFGVLALVTVILSGVARLATNAIPPPDRQAWRTAVFLVLVVTMVRVATFAHPDSPVSDGMFHVHRAQAVRAGNYIFTSITPRPFYEFPYPVGLYVAAQPLWETVQDRVALLRGITLVTDALVAIALFAVTSARRGRSTGLLAATFALTFPVVIQSVSTANLTNVFAQSCFSLAVLWIASQLSSSRTWLAIGVAVLLLTASYLSHFSTAVIGGPAMVAAAIAVACARDGQERRAWRWIVVSVVLAAALSYIVYYSHFTDVYARTLAKVGAEKAPTSLVATLAEHSESKPITLLRFLVANYGWAALALSTIGVIVALRRDWRDAWTLALIGVGATIIGFLLLGAFTPIEMRANLAAHPVVAAFAALGTSSLWESRRWPLRIAAGAGVAATIWVGISALIAVLN